ncbi:glycine cleavage system p-protein [Ditylenchus destructor]|nr:glycine cleavage system p-protein [Ditylenchus destructor]
MLRCVARHCSSCVLQHGRGATFKLSFFRYLNYDCFADRHIGPTEVEKQQMLSYLGFKDLETLTNTIVPEGIRLKRDLDLPAPKDEWRMLTELRDIAAKNKQYRSFIGMGYYDCIVPGVILRNVLQNAGWTTPYTPYQPEIAQGRLESLINFQTMISDLTGLDVANASLLDESTACAEAMCMAVRATKRNIFLYDPHLHPQNIAVLKTRAKPLDIEVLPLDRECLNLTENVAGIILQYPNTEGQIYDNIKDIVEAANANGSIVVVACDPLSLTLLRSPGELGAHVAIGSAQRFGLPLFYGGPHPAFMAVQNKLARSMPGRIVGVSRDSSGNRAYRLALQTREQHIRRDKATSNICTAQALPANIAAMYAVYHGPHRLAEIARTINKSVAYLAQQLKANDIRIAHDVFFDTIKVKPKNMTDFKVRSEDKQINVRFFENSWVGISLDECTLASDLKDLLYLFDIQSDVEKIESSIQATPAPLVGNSVHIRHSGYLTHPVFNSYHSESQLMRYIKRLESRDVSLAHSMIPLGSCTMKLNASAELAPITWPKFSNIHPFAPPDQTRGYAQIFNDLERWLCELTGYDNFSLQPNSGANGEYAGLLAIKGYLESTGQEQKKICLIPTSAHGTNPASAQLANFKVCPVESDKHGNVNYKDLSAKAEKYKDELAAIMITYPSTHGVFESSIEDVCNKVHECGGQVYLDGANFNAQVGLCRPGDYGSDVSHLNLHKTFCIPHGGGGPGAGPIGVKSHLAPYLPGHPIVSVSNGLTSGTVSGAPWGSSAILTITWAYIRLMGAVGLKAATGMSILNANYMAKRLEEGGFRVVYKGEQGLNAHEFIIDCKPFKKSVGVDVVDIAKRLMDYGFHAPTMAWPVQDCLMIEPTESEDKDEMDRFVDSLLAIREEIINIEKGVFDKEKNPLKMAPHTLEVLMSSKWDRPYTRELAGFPKPWCSDGHKVWPYVGRIDDQYGDRNLFCTCPPMTSDV